MLSREQIAEITKNGIEKIAMDYGYQLTTEEKEEISYICEILESLNPHDSTILHILNQFEKRLHQIDELKKEIANLECKNTKQQVEKAEVKLAEVTKISSQGALHFPQAKYPSLFVVEAALASIVMGFKADEDLAIWNLDFEKGANYTYNRINQIETIHWKAIDHNISFKRPTGSGLTT